MSRYRKSMGEIMAEVEKIGHELPEVSPPGWEGSVKAMKKHKDIDNPWALAWHMKNKGDKPHYKDQDGKPEKKAKYKNEEIDTDGVVQLHEELPVGHRSPSPGSDSTDSYAKMQAAKRKAKAAGDKEDNWQKYHEDVELDEKHDCDEVHPDVSHEDWVDQKDEDMKLAPKTGPGRKAAKALYKEDEVDESDIQARHGTHVPKGINPAKLSKDALEVIRKRRAEKAKEKLRHEDVEIDEWGNSILDKQRARISGRPDTPKKKEKSAYQKNVDYDTARHAAKTKYMKKEEAEIDEAGPRGGGPLSRLRGEDPEKRRIRLTKQKERARKKYVASKGGDPRSVKMYTDAQLAAQQAKKADAQARSDDQMKGAPNPSDPEAKARAHIKHRKENPQRKEEVEMAIMSIDHKEAPRKLKITQKGLDALRADRDRPKVKTQVKITKKGREAIKDEVEVEALDLKKIRALRRAKAAKNMKDVEKVFNKKTKPTKDMKVEPRHDASERGSDRGYFEEVEIGEALPPHLSKFLDKKGNPNKEAQARIDAGRKKRAAAAAKPKITDVTPKGYGPSEGLFSGKTKARVTKSIFNDPVFRKITGRKSMKDVRAKQAAPQKEEMDFKVKLKGLPAFYVPGKSAAAIKLMLRRQVKRPDDIEGVDRVTRSAKRKDFRLRGQGKSVEPKQDGE